MRETKFIEQNKEKWQELEDTLDSERRDPEKLNRLFIQITDDLSYSRTFYTNRSVRVYLNSLAQRIYFSIYRGRQRSGLKSVAWFWAEELPRLIYESRRDFLYAFLVFALAFGIGVLSSAMDPEFSALILGESYVDMTEANIASGDPMAVYKQRGQFGMSLGITANNLFVSFLTFVSGLLAGAGTLIIMIRNGVMVGAFQYFFIERDLFWESFLTIWIHGTLEISAIIIAGAAGLTMGRGLAFPGTYTRMRAFRQSARRGLKILVGIVPVIILAGFIEGYLTRHTDTADWVRLLFILACIAFVLTYFVWYPWVKARMGFRQKEEAGVSLPDEAYEIRFGVLKSAGDIFSESFIIIRENLGYLARYALLGSLLFCLPSFLLTPVPATELFSYPGGLFGTLSVLDHFYVNRAAPWIVLLQLVITALLMDGLQRLVARQEKPDLQEGWKARLTSSLRAMLPALLIMLAIWTNSWYTSVVLLLIIPISMLWHYVQLLERLNSAQALSRTLQLINGNFGRLLNLALLLSLVSILFYGIIDTFLLWSYIDLISWVVNLSDYQLQQVSVILLTGVASFMLYLMGSLLVIGFALQYTVLREVREAGFLRKRIQQIGKRQQIRGIEQEQQVL